VRGENIFDVAVASPLSKENIHEAKIVARFWIVAILLAILALATFETEMSERIVILVEAKSGTGAALLAKAQGFDVFVSDMGPIKDKYKAELEQENIAYETGVHTEAKILNAAYIIKSPGIPDKAPMIKAAKAAEFR